MAVRHSMPVLGVAMMLLVASASAGTPDDPGRLSLMPPAGYAKDTVARSGGQMPVYRPRRENAPRAPIGGGHHRGSDTDVPQLIALVPDHLAFTIKSSPSPVGIYQRIPPGP